MEEGANNKWAEKAQQLLEKVREKQQKTWMANGNGHLDGGKEREMLEKLSQILEKNMGKMETSKRSSEEELADKRARQHLSVYGTLTNGMAAKKAAAAFLNAKTKPRTRSGTMASSMGNGGATMGTEQQNGGTGMDAILEEPWRGSCQFSDIMEAMGQNGDIQNGPGSDVEELDYEREPWPIRAIIHAALFASTIAYLLAGAQIFRWIDPGIGEKVFPKAFVWTFQLATTIGWGDSKAMNSWSQAFTVLYVLFAIPMIFACFANLGRLATEFACIGWPRIKCWILRRPFAREEHRLPLLSALNFLCLHQSLGIFLYSYWFKQWPVIGTVYYSITTMATIGFGDYHPDTDHWGETIIALLYLSSGITLLSMLFLNIAFHFQTLHYEIFKDFIQNIYTKFWLKFRQRWEKKGMRNNTDENGVDKSTNT